MVEALQNTLIKNMADFGCYFLCLCEIAEKVTVKHVDIIRTAIYARNYDWIDNEFTVNNPEALLTYLTGKRIKVTKSKSLPEGTEYYVEKWTNPKTGLSHFRLHDWDSLEDSITVRDGNIESYRIVEIK